MLIALNVSMELEFAVNMSIKQNIIVLGDSFCSDKTKWPSWLANHLDLNLICHTEGAGQAWWDSRNWLNHVHTDCFEQTKVIVFAHTNAERIPAKNRELGRIDHSATPKTETEKAISLYYKYVFHAPFMHWAQQCWFKEITEKYNNLQLVHLHCFPWSNQYSNLLTGLNITTNLSAISLNELGVKKMTLYNDTRPNHLNEHNNQQLALQLAQLINRGAQGDHALDITKFEQKTFDWFTNSNWE
jgi:hypothetical protein